MGYNHTVTRMKSVFPKTRNERLESRDIATTSLATRTGQQSVFNTYLVLFRLFVAIKDQIPRVAFTFLLEEKAAL